MIQHKNKWKLGALLLAAPLLAKPWLVPAVAQDADGNFSPAETVAILKKWKNWTSADGDIYVFQHDGVFSRRHGRSTQDATYSVDAGRFTVKERGNEPGDLDSSANMLHLRITNSVRKSDGQSVKRSDTAVIGIIVVPSSKKGGGQSKPSLLLGGSDGFRLK